MCSETFKMKNKKIFNFSYFNNVIVSILNDMRFIGLIIYENLQVFCYFKNDFWLDCFFGVLS